MGNLMNKCSCSHNENAVNTSGYYRSNKIRESVTDILEIETLQKEF